MTTLFSGQQLVPGQSISSNNGFFALTAQQDGNVVLYDVRPNASGMPRALWATYPGTPHGPSKNFAMQNDGNLVLYSTDGQARWASNTSGNPGAFLNIQNNGRIVVYRANSSTPTRNNALWTSDLSATGVGGNYIVGYYKWTYASPPLPTPSFGANVGIAFSGYADPNAALSNSAGVRFFTPGLQYICLGGGTAPGGHFTAAIVNSITAAINANMFNGYQGIVFDIELGDSGLAGPFNAAFAAAKSKELDVVMTTSYSAPFMIGDAAALMASFFQNNNIDYLSPQLYTHGTESQNDFSANSAVAWSQWSGPNRPGIIPSMVRSSFFNPGTDSQNGANSFFVNKLGLKVSGLFQWSQGPLT
jgi:hypothetical protein